MLLRRASLGLLVGTILIAPRRSAAPAIVFEPYKGTVLYEDPKSHGSRHP